jgi:hypothetical protein
LHLKRDLKGKRGDLKGILKINSLPQKGFDQTKVDSRWQSSETVLDKMTLQAGHSEGFNLSISGCRHGSVMNISNKFDHREMPEDRKQYIGFEWKRKFAGTTRGILCLKRQSLH